MTFRLSTAFQRNRPRYSGTQVNAHDTVRFAGGLNLVDSALSIQPGELLVCKNYEPNYINGAYVRVEGYERFDGQPRPHLAEYWKLELVVTGGPFTVGETVTADDPAASTATVAAYEVAAVPPTSEDFPNDDYVGVLTLTDLTDQVDSGVTWTGGSSGATGAGGAPEYGGFSDEDEHDTAQLAAESIRRDAIDEVGTSANCSGPVRGVWVFNDNVYAFRDNVGQTAGTMWKATTNGWTQVNLGIKIYFQNGSEEIVKGSTITGGTSSATATAERVVVTSGFWSGGDAAGYIIASSVSNGPFNTSEDINVAAVKYAEVGATTAQENQTLPAGGEYRFRNYNFGGNTATFAMYGVNGVGNAFEYDGDIFTLIETGMETDAPDHVGVHYGHLLLAFPGGSLQHSGKNNPLSFTPVTGANELLAGDEITGFIEEVQDVTFVFTRNKTFRLQGFVLENMQLRLHSEETGAIANTIQRIGESIYLDDRGFTTRAATDQFGDFASNQIGLKVDPLVQSLLDTYKTVDASVVHRGKSLYRCFFGNEAVVFGFSGNRVSAITTIDYNLNIRCAANNEIAGIERVFVGVDEGYVYETDVGRNFDGAEIEAYLVTAYHFSGSPEYNVRYRRATVYIDGSTRTSMQIFADYNYNGDPQNWEEIMNRAAPLGGGRYGLSRHDEFNYSSESKQDIRVSMNSHARNVSLIFYHKEANEGAHTVHAVNYHMSKRRMIRQ